MTTTDGCDAPRVDWNATADGWDRHMPQIRAWLAGATATMLDMAGVGPGMHVLDIAAGTGDQSCDIAKRVGDEGSVLATDISERMLVTAAANLRAAGHAGTRTLVADAAALELDGANFDAATCRLGLMFLPDPLRGLRSVRRALRSGGRFGAMVFSEPSRNPCIGIVAAIAARHAGLPAADPGAPGGLMSLGAPGLIEDLFRSAGFVDVEVRRVDAPFSMASVDAYLEFIRTAAGPVASILDGIGEPSRGEAWAEIADALAPFAHADGWKAPTELLVVGGAR